MAYPVYNLDEYVRNLTVECDAHPVLIPLKVIIEAWRIANAPSMLTPVTQDVRNQMLKLLTGSVVGLDQNVNCYPVGYTTQLLYDLDGNPIY